MSFLRPTESSLRRVQTTLEAQHRPTAATTPSPTPSAIAGAAQPLPVRPAVRDSAMPDYAGVPSRTDSGLQSRVQTSALSRRRTRSATPKEDPDGYSPSLRAFTNKCDSVIQRAQELLDRTQAQERLVAKALEERLSQSPSRRGGTPSPPLSQGGDTAVISPPLSQPPRQQTPPRWFGGFTSSSSPAPLAQTPGLPPAPHTTPVAQPRADGVTPRAEEEGLAWQPSTPPPSPSRHGLGEWLGLRASSPSQQLLPPAPPPTPIEPQRGGTATSAAPPSALTGAHCTLSGTGGMGGAAATGKSETSGSSSSPSSTPLSFLQYVRQSLQRTPLAGVEASPTAPPNDGFQSSHTSLPTHFINASPTGRGTQHASPRKSVKFVSPDKLESVTPTKVVVFPDSDTSTSEGDEEDEMAEAEVSSSSSSSTDEENEAAAQAETPPCKKSRAETPKRGSSLRPPAPPSSAVKSPTQQQQQGRRSSAHAEERAPSPPSPSSASQRTRSPTPTSATALAVSPPSRTSPPPPRGSRASQTTRSVSRSPSTAEDEAADGRSAMHHDELKAYVMQHTIRQSLAYLSKTEMKRFLKEEGSPVAQQRHVLKKKLLTEIRALIKRQSDAEQRKP